MHPQIENYLEQVESQLKGLTFRQHTEELRELELHLQALVEEGQERGLNESEAIQAALKQFGPGRKVGRALNKAVVSTSPPHLSRAFAAISVIMMVHAVLIVMLWGVLLVPTNWTASVQAHGIEGIIGFFSLELFRCALSIQIALLLRQLRPWAFWLALFLTSYQCVTEARAVFEMFSAFPNISTGVIFLLPTLFCVVTLVMNRRTYLHIARAKWST